MRMTSVEKTTEITKLQLAYAMNVCMKHAPVEDITVRHICQEAHLSRQTFYRCFQDKYDLINWYFDRILNESFARMGQGRTIRESLIKKFNYIQEEAMFFRAAFAYDKQNNLQKHDFDMIFAMYQSIIQSKTKQPVPRDILNILDMYCYASVYKTVQWLMQEMPVSPEELADTMLSAMPLPLVKLFQQLEILR